MLSGPMPRHPQLLKHRSVLPAPLRRWPSADLQGPPGAEMGQPRTDKRADDRRPGRPFQLEDYRALSLLRARTFNHSPWGYDVQISPALPCISGWSRTSLLVPNLMMSNPTGILQPQEQQIGSFPTSEGVFPIFKEAPCAGRRSHCPSRRGL